MLFNPSLLKDALSLLDQKLEMSPIAPIELKICGGGALMIMGISDRETRDVDVILPKLPESLITFAREIAIELNLTEEWLNNGPENLIRDLEKGWEDRCELIYKGNALKIFILGRKDLIATKLFAYCDREEADFEDLLKLRPTQSELDQLYHWVLNRDASEYWPPRVEKQLKRLKNKLGYEITTHS